MNQVEELVKVVEAAKADQGNVVIVTGKPGSVRAKSCVKLRTKRNGLMLTAVC